MNEKRNYIICLAGMLCFCIKGKGQTTVVHDSAVVKGTTVVIPGKEYDRSNYHNFFWGSHYRKEWSTPVRVNNFYLDTAVGGLVPYAEGGGRQTKTLRLRSKTGKEYVLRSVNKDFGRALSEEMQGTFLSRIAKDQVSIGHPFAAITITPMSQAAGIYHTIPSIVFVPKQPALDTFNNAFGDQLYLFEQRPDENWEEAPNFGNSQNIIGTERLFEHLHKDNDNHVDERSFLRARLFDMIIGDWGRHPDNWRWAKFESGKYNIYKPVPRDRDQVYTKLDGLYPSLAGKVYKPLQGFNASISNSKAWNVPGRTLDKLLLNGLGKEEWTNQVAFLQQVLTDSLIISSVRQMPPQLYAISGEEIAGRLRSRRDRLGDIAMDYYDFLARHAYVPGSQDREFFQINKISENETQVLIYKITKEGTLREPAFYSRTFKKDETKEIRVYGLEGRDIIEVKGESEKGVKVRIIDPDKSDSVYFEREELESNVRVYAGKKFEYDTAHEKKLDLSLRPIISSSIYKVFDRNPLKLFPRTGVKVIASITYRSNPWKKEEYESIHQLCANYGFLRGAFNAGYVGRFGKFLGKWDLVMKARIDAPAVENYFGTGNNTKILNNTRNYYRTFSHRLFGSIGLESNFSTYHHAEFSAIYQSVKVHRTEGKYISEVQPFIQDPSVFNRKNFVGAEAGYYFLKTDNNVFPLMGGGFSIGAGHLRNIQNKDEAFTKILFNSVAFIPIAGPFSVALKAGAATLSGTADYYNLNSIGGGGSGEMRGYERERFYGKHTVYGNADLRWLFNTKNYLFNGRAGLLGFYDIGRVWMPGEKSNLWHASYGGGVIFIPYNKYALTVTYGRSKEGGQFNFKTGFFF